MSANNPNEWKEIISMGGTIALIILSLCLGIGGCIAMADLSLPKSSQTEKSPNR